MKVKLARSLSKQLAAAHGIDHECAAEGAIVEVENDELVQSGLAEKLIVAVLKDAMKAVPKGKKDE